MNTVSLALWLVLGVSAWVAAGCVATGTIRRETAALWAGPMAGGAVAVTVLAQLDRSVPAFDGVASRAALFWVVSAGVFLAASFADERVLESLRWPFFAGALGAQAFALVAGLGPVEQIRLTLPVLGAVVVSEPVRVLLILGTAGVVARLEPVLDQPLNRSVLRPLVVAGLCWVVSAGLSFAARDTGAAALSLTVLALAALFVLGRPRPTLAILGTGAVGIGLAAVLYPHAVARITSFLSPPTGSRIDQARMALFAASSGRLVGHPDGGKNLQYVGSTLDDDFLLAAVGRVLGLTGMVAVIIIVTVTAVACLRPLQAPGPYGLRRWAGVMAGCLLSAQLLLSAGGVLGVVPATGVPVPSMTGSGASLVAVALLIGIAAGGQRARTTIRPALPALRGAPA